MKNLTKKSIVALVAVSLTGLAAISISLALRQKEIPDVTEKDTVSPAAIPSIDAAAPVTTETAIFAMG